MNRLVSILFSFVLTVVVFTPLCVSAQTSDIQDVVWQQRSVAEGEQSPYIARIIDYRPAPGQFINEAAIGTLKAAQSIVGGLSGIVSLGGFGGYIIVGFDHTILNDPANPFGIDFTVVGNSVGNSSEAGIVSVMADSNGNGLPDDGEWYELRGSRYDAPSTVHDYSIIYKPAPENSISVPWTDGTGRNGWIYARPEHTQPYYPLPALFPSYPQDSATFTGTCVQADVDSSNRNFIIIKPLEYGYADNIPFRHDIKPITPDNPTTVDVVEGNGGDAFDISWAVDASGKAVNLDGIDFVRIHTAVNLSAGWLGELSTEICGIIDVAPDDVLANRDEAAVQLAVYPNPTTDCINISSPAAVAEIELFDTSGRRLKRIRPAAANVTMSLSGCRAGVYLLSIHVDGLRICRKIVKN